MSKEEDIREILRQAAGEIAEAQNNPRTWLTWIIYLLARLEEQAAKTGPAHREAFMEMLEALRSELRNRAATGGWH